ncbi:family 18 glycoside hydrolase [Cryphonectria parasitica EP155]|uniref:Family 18 glycoside hydrolase n=1 Tax=Cryphonectria parasitica (strain ATCC 38755 / EP155) TaxID=660469 RepID=A0A9P5CU22_CRYP1|nr:family 18 glycoside hydrolase [Cryphonectria parasitica EP155]KAF3771229.1 family 18 glycoside hydrolase [Cryphonectria parasitica EP155]
MAPLPSPDLPRLVIYFQSHHKPDGSPVSLLPLIQQPGIRLTHLNIAAFHINRKPDPSHIITLNDNVPGHPSFTTLWAEARILQAAGVKVMGMLGGAAKGAFAKDTLDSDDEATFERYYGALHDMVLQRGLDGLDLDVEEPFSLAGIVRLIDRLRADFGKDFIISLAPVAPALLDVRRNLSGFDYEALEVMRGRDIAFYNCQFYCGWGDCSNPILYEMMLMKGWNPAKVVVGLVTNPANGSGFIPFDVLATVVPLMVGQHKRFGGIMGWEYFNSLPGGREKPWEWAQYMTRIMGTDRTTAPDVVMPVGRVEVPPPPPAAPAEGQQQKKLIEVDADEDEEGGREVPVPDAFEYYSDGLGEEE